MRVISLGRMILAELEAAYREACLGSGKPTVIVCMQVAEEDIRIPKPSWKQPA